MIKIQMPALALRRGVTILVDDRPHIVWCVDQRADTGLIEVGCHDCETNEWAKRTEDQYTVFWPSAGDVVRLTHKWDICEKGDIGIIGGMVHQYADGSGITFRCCSVYRNHNESISNGAEYVSGNGGPAPIRQDLSRLRWTGEEMAVWFWRWTAGLSSSSEEYPLHVPVWEWDGQS